MERSDDLLPKDDNQVISRILVSQADLGRIIGKGGETVTNIRAKCGAVIKGFNLEDTENKLLVIGGTMVEVLEGFDMVAAVLYEPWASREATGAFHMDILVDNSRAGRILGPKGCTVSTVRNESQCTVVRLIKEPVEVCNQQLRTILLEGGLPNIQKAHFMLQQLVYENTPNQVAPAVRIDGTLPGMNPPVMDRDRDFGVRDNRMDSRDRDIGGYRGDRSSRDRDGRGGSSSQSARVLVDFGVPLALAADAEKLVNQLNSYGVDVSFQRGTGGRVDRDRDRDMNVGIKNQYDSRDRGGYGGSTRQPERGPNIRPEQQKFEFMIPVDRVGSVLGVGGRNSKDIQQEFKVFLHIDKEEVNGCRKVSLGGSDINNMLKAKARIIQAVEDNSSAPPNLSNQGGYGGMSNSSSSYGSYGSHNSNPSPSPAGYGSMASGSGSIYGSSAY